MSIISNMEAENNGKLIASLDSKPEQLHEREGLSYPVKCVVYKDICLLILFSRNRDIANNAGK